MLSHRCRVSGLDELHIELPWLIQAESDGIGGLEPLVGDWGKGG